MLLFGMLVYLDGSFVDNEQAMVSVFDHGFLFGEASLKPRELTMVISSFSRNILPACSGVSIPFLPGLLPSCVRLIRGRYLHV